MLEVMNREYVLVFIVAYKILSYFLRGPSKSVKKLPTCYMAVAGRVLIGGPDQDKVVFYMFYILHGK